VWRDEVRKPRHVEDEVILTDRFLTGVSYGIGIHAIAKDQYPCYRGPDGVEAFDKGLILGRYQSGMGQIKGRLEQSSGSRVYNVTVSYGCGGGRRVARGCGFVSSYYIAIRQEVRNSAHSSCYSWATEARLESRQSARERSDTGDSHTLKFITNYMR
jgi:hypothetical protein